MTGSAGLPYTDRVASKCAPALAFLLALLTADPAWAEHAIHYRYTVLGYVKDAAGAARPRVQVELVREKTGFSYLGETDTTGLYVIVARLGDESLGERLRLRVQNQPVSIIARFNPSDHGQERGTRVDFLGAQSVEMPAAFATTLRHFLDR